MKRQPPYPYLNLGLLDLPGEQWDDVPGFEGAYQVSNFGRIKSLRRWRHSGTGGCGYYTKEGIRKPRLTISHNKHLNTHTYTLGITLKQDGRSRSISIARYVYTVFIAPFDIDAPSVVISYKDYDGRNLRPNNLILTNRSATQKRSYQLKRAHSHWQENKLAVVQLDMSGNEVARYESLSEAARKTGFHLGAIKECTKGRLYQHKGYQWRLTDISKGASPKKQIPVIFNSYLWEKLQRPKTSKRNPIPVLNLSLENLEGEKWKFIEGLNETYQISNLGRVKSMGRLKGKKRPVWLKEHIQKLVADGNASRPASCLLAPLSKNGKKYQQSLARLVYYHFVEPFNLADKSKRVYYKDGCFYNLHYTNLILL